jgi:hypothetical protein
VRKFNVKRDLQNQPNITILFYFGLKSKTQVQILPNQNDLDNFSAVKKQFPFQDLNYEILLDWWMLAEKCPVFDCFAVHISGMISTRIQNGWRA